MATLGDLHIGDTFTYRGDKCKIVLVCDSLINPVVCKNITYDRVMCLDIDTEVEIEGEEHEKQ